VTGRCTTASGHSTTASGQCAPSGSEFSYNPSSSIWFLFHPPTAASISPTPCPSSPDSPPTGSPPPPLPCCRAPALPRPAALPRRARTASPCCAASPCPHRLYRAAAPWPRRHCLTASPPQLAHQASNPRLLLPSISRASILGFCPNPKFEGEILSFFIFNRSIPSLGFTLTVKFHRLSSLLDSALSALIRRIREISQTRSSYLVIGFSSIRGSYRCSIHISSYMLAILRVSYLLDYVCCL
jgi:hypothetical protein